jgi:hypothetical protein
MDKRTNIQYKEPSIISGTGAVIWSKVTLGLLAAITLEVIPFRVYAPLSAVLPFLNASWKSCSVGVFSIGRILPRLPQLCQNGGLSI